MNSQILLASPPPNDLEWTNIITVGKSVGSVTNFGFDSTVSNSYGSISPSTAAFIGELENYKDFPLTLTAIYDEQYKWSGGAPIRPFSSMIYVSYSWYLGILESMDLYVGRYDTKRCTINNRQNDIPFFTDDDVGKEVKIWFATIPPKWSIFEQ